MLKKTVFIIVIIAFVASIIGFALVSSFTTPSDDRVRNQINTRKDEIDTDVLTGEKVDTSFRVRQTIEGTIKPLESSIYQEGTHILSVAGTNLSILESDQVDLSSYEGKNVKVSGESRRTIEGDGSIMTVESIEEVK